MYIIYNIIILYIIINKYNNNISDFSEAMQARRGLSETF